MYYNPKIAILGSCTDCLKGYSQHLKKSFQMKLPDRSDLQSKEKM